MGCANRAIRPLPGGGPVGGPSWRDHAPPGLLAEVAAAKAARDAMLAGRAGDPTASVLIFACSTGLKANAEHSVACLAKLGVRAFATSDRSPDAIRAAIKGSPRARFAIIEAPTVKGEDVRALALAFPRVRFVVRCHSQAGFLQVDPDGTANFKAAAAIAATLPNVVACANSPRMARAAEAAWGVACPVLPNLYDLPAAGDRPPRDPAAPLRMASFGAIRAQKNHGVAAFAAAIVARRIGRPAEFHVNAGRVEHGVGVLPMIRNVLDGTGTALVEAGWMPPAEFRDYAATMDLGWQLSATETFNVVTADLAAAGVPSVVGPAIDWMPGDMIADIDDPEEAAGVALRLLSDPTAGRRARRALEAHQGAAEAPWWAFLAGWPKDEERASSAPASSRSLALGRRVLACPDRSRKPGSCGCNGKAACGKRGGVEVDWATCLACVEDTPA